VADAQTCGTSVIFAILSIGLCLLGQTAIQAKTIRIVVTGDCRSDYPWNDKREGDKDGINQKTMEEIARGMAAENPQIVLWTGDIVNVNGRAGPNPENKTIALENGLKTWREIIGRYFGTNKHVKILPVRGNHEVQWYEEKDSNPFAIADALGIWKKVFQLPPNGPTCEKGTSFWYATGPVLCVGLDQYENRHHLIHQHWLDGVLEKNRNGLKKPFVFAYGHESAFVTGGNHTREETLAAYPHYRDRMWKSLEDAGARVYFCGHDHFYDHMVVRRTSTPPGAEMHQLTAGTAGAPYYQRKSDYPADEDWQLEQANHSDFVYGYILVVVEENRAPKKNTATIEFKAQQSDGHFEQIDRFEYSVEAP